MQYGRNIRRLRLSKGIKAQWVADQLGIHISTYSNLEADRGKIDLDRAERIASLLGVSVQDILHHGISDTLTQKTGTEAGD
ncbi:MAG: helix-turn-helix transcriptional regulator [Candidatus Methanomethyliaceae archaeon]